jgi:hypothetical protein
MAEKARPSTTSDYSASQSAETQEGAQDREHDHRAIPGGDPARSTASLGMESLDKSTHVSTDAGPSDFTDSPGDQAPPRPGQP